MSRESPELTPVPTPCTIDLTSRGLPEHPPNGVEKGEAGPSPDEEAGPRNHEGCRTPVLDRIYDRVVTRRVPERVEGWRSRCRPGGRPASPARTAAQRAPGPAGSLRRSAGRLTWPAGEPSVTVWLLQRGRDVVPERGRHIGSGRDDPAEPGHRGDRHQHVGDLVLGRARCQGPAGAPFQADRWQPDGHRCAYPH